MLQITTALQQHAQFEEPSASDRRNPHQETDPRRRVTAKAEQESCADRCTRTANPWNECERLGQADDDTIERCNPSERTLQRLCAISEPEQRCARKYRDCNNQWRPNVRIKEVPGNQSNKYRRDGPNDDRDDQPLICRITATPTTGDDWRKCTAEKSCHISSQRDEYRSKGAEVEHRTKCA
jgi:hypothetical protein